MKEFEFGYNNDDNIDDRVYIILSKIRLTITKKNIFDKIISKFRMKKTWL